MKIIDPTTGKPYYQKRLQHFDEPGHARALTFSCYHGYRFLNSDRTRQWLVDALKEARQEWGFLIWGYVIMPEHFHALIYPRPDAPNLTGVLRDIKEPVGRKAIAHLKKHAPEWLARVTVREGKRVRRRFWQPGSGYDRNVVEIPAARNQIEYFHGNPVRRGLVERPEDWQWSSARWYAGIRPVPLEMDPLFPETE